MADKDEKDGCGPAIVALAAAGPLIALRGWVGSVLWGWFIVPLGAPSVTLWHACGIFGLVYLATTNKADDGNYKEWERVSYVVFYGLTNSLMALGVGWAFHALMGHG